MKQEMTSSYTSSSLTNHGVTPKQFGMAYKANQRKARHMLRVRGGR